MLSLMKRARLWFAAAALSLVGPILATGVPLVGAGTAQAEIINQIQVVGVVRVEPATVISYLTIRPGIDYDAGDVNDSVLALFATGLFSAVDIVRQVTTLFVTVVENPVITAVAFEGNSRLDDSTLAGLGQLRAGSVLTDARVRADTERILEEYRRSGRYLATVTPQIIQLENNQVNLVYEIDEGPRTEVQRITFVGNDVFSDSVLKRVITTREAGLFGFLRTSDTYDPDRIRADEELLRRHYLSRGYADFRVVSTVAEFDRETNGFYITITVEEGPLYRFGALTIETTLTEINPASLQALIEMRSGQVYNVEDVQATLEALTLAAAELGYAFVDVRTRVLRDPATQTIALTFLVDEGQRVYIERIEIVGNTRTQDDVIRREFDVAEGDAFNQVLIARAERRLLALGHFSSVDISVEPGSAVDRVILVVAVVDQPTGELSGAVTYSTADGFAGEVSITETNLLGRSQTLRISVGMGASRQTYDVSFTDPYFLGQRMSFGIDAYSRTIGEGAGRPYSQVSQGGGLRLGLPLAEHLSFGATLQYFQQTIDIPDIYQDGDTTNGEASPVLWLEEGVAITSAATLSVTYNSLNSRLQPTEGVYSRFSIEVAGLLGTTQYLKARGGVEFYTEIWPEVGLVGHVLVHGGYVSGLGADLRFSDQFQLGGQNFPGFAPGGIGPRDATTGFALGGTAFFVAQAEAIFPFPFLPPDLGFFGSVHVTIGSLWGTDLGTIAAANALLPPATDITVASNAFALRGSVGGSIIWNSPIGPLEVGAAYAFLTQPSDVIQIWQFGVSGGLPF